MLETTEKERRKNRRGTNDDNCALLFSVQRFLSLSLSRSFVEREKWRRRSKRLVIRRRRV